MLTILKDPNFTRIFLLFNLDVWCYLGVDGCIFSHGRKYIELMISFEWRGSI